MRIGNGEFSFELTDCVNGMRTMHQSTADVVVTSPPYNLGMDYKNYRDRKPREDYLIWTWAWTKEVKRILRDDGSFFLNLSAASKDPVLPFEIAIGLCKRGWVLQNTLHWIKSISVEEPDGRRTTVGPFRPKNSDRYVSNCHEYIFHFSKHGTVRLDKEAIGIEYKCRDSRRSALKLVRCRGNTWFIRYPPNYVRFSGHPAPFPIEVPEYCIKLHGSTDQLVVVDPFLGIGSSAIAGLRCGVKRFVGFEIAPGYIETAERRLSNEFHRPSQATSKSRVSAGRTSNKQRAKGHPELPF